MSLSYINRSNDEEIIDIVRSVLDNGTGRAECLNEHVLIKLMQIRGTPIRNMSFDQERVNRLYLNWVNDGKAAQDTKESAQHISQQLQAKIRAIVAETVEAQNGNVDAGELLVDLLADLRVLSAM